MAQEATLALMKESAKPLRAIDLVKLSKEKGLFAQETSITGLIQRDLSKLLAKGRVERLADKTWIAKAETAPVAGIDYDEKRDETEGAISPENIVADPALAPPPEVLKKTKRGQKKSSKAKGRLRKTAAPSVDAAGHNVNDPDGCKKCGDAISAASIKAGAEEKEVA